MRTRMEVPIRQKEDKTRILTSIKQELYDGHNEMQRKEITHELSSVFSKLEYLADLMLAKTPCSR